MHYTKDNINGLKIKHCVRVGDFGIITDVRENLYTLTAMVSWSRSGSSRFNVISILDYLDNGQWIPLKQSHHFKIY